MNGSEAGRDERPPTLRRAQPSDAPAVADCVAVAYRHYVARLGQAPGPLLDDYAQVVRDSLVWVLEEGAGPAACIVGVAVLVLEEHRALLENVAVRPECQGRGLGRRLIAWTESQAARRGHRDIELYTHVLMVENQALYQRLGYREFDRRFERGLDRIYMRKSLRA